MKYTYVQVVAIPMIGAKKEVRAQAIMVRLVETSVCSLFKPNPPVGWIHS